MFIPDYRIGIELYCNSHLWVRYCFEIPRDDDSDSQVRVSRKLDNAVMTAWLIRTSSSCCIIDKNGRYFSCPQGNCLKTAYNNVCMYVSTLVFRINVVVGINVLVEILLKNACWWDFFCIYDNTISMSFLIIQAHFAHFLHEINKGMLIGFLPLKK